MRTQNVAPGRSLRVFSSRISQQRALHKRYTSTAALVAIVECDASEKRMLQSGLCLFPETGDVVMFSFSKMMVRVATKLL
jgi:hypothetical protein